MAVNPPNVLWVGPREVELGWLYDRLHTASRLTAGPRVLAPFTQAGGSHACDASAIDSLEPWLEKGVQRLVLACQNRWDYPARHIDWLQTRWPEVPRAIATSSWWEGAGRTGVGHGAHAGATDGVMLPWYRWWDGWRPWLSAASAEWFNPASPSPVVYSDWSGGERLQRFNEVAGFAESARGAVLVGNDSEQLQTWREVLGQRPVLVLTEAELSSQSSNEGAETGDGWKDIGWCLIDDSSLHTLPHFDRDVQWLRLVKACRARFSTSRIVCAMRHPDWALWTKLTASGADEFLAKPTTGWGLRCLMQERDRPA